MSFKKCIQDKVAQGLIDSKQGKELVDALENEIKEIDPKTAYNRIKKARMENKDSFIRNYQLHEGIKRKVFEKIDSVDNPLEKVNVVRDEIKRSNTQAQVEHNNILKIANKDLKGGLVNQNPLDVKEAITAVLDKREAGSVQAKKIKQNIQNSFKYAKNEAEALGLIMGDLGDSYIPRSYNRNKVRKLSTNDFVNGLIDLVEWQGRTRSQMVDFLKAAKLEIQTGGRMSKLEEAVALGENSFAKKKLGELETKRNHSREIHFKDSAAHFKAMDLVGNGKDSFVQDIQRYFFSMSQDLGMARNLGPTARKLVDEADAKIALAIEKKKLSNPDYKVPFGTGRNRGLMKAEFNVMTNTAFTGDRDAPLYRFFVGTQLWQRAAHLGSAVVSALSDMNFNAMTNKLNGGSFLSSFKDYFGYMSGLNRKELKSIAEDMGLYSEIFTGNLFDETRFSISNESDGVMRKLSDFTFKASGLNAWTKVGKIIAQVNANNVISKQIGQKKSWSSLGSILKDRLSQAGIDEGKWQKLLDNAEVHKGSRDFINTDDMRFKDPEASGDLYDLADDLDRFIFQTQDMVVNENNLTTRAITSGAAIFGKDGQVGTGGKAFSEAIFQYKNFPITVMLNHLFPAFENFKKGGKGILEGNISKDNAQLVGHLGLLVVGTGLMATVPLQLKEVLKGKSFKEFDTDLFVAALAQGGGAGILGDFLFNDTSRFGNSLLATAAGPYASTTESVYDTFIGNPKSRKQGGLKNGSLAEDVVKLARRNTPVVSSLWYTRLFTERLIFDSLERMVNPNFDKKVRRAKRRLAKEDRQYWWGQNDSPDPTAIR